MTIFGRAQSSPATDPRLFGDDLVHRKALTYRPVHRAPPLSALDCRDCDAMAERVHGTAGSDGPLHRRDTDPAVTETTLYSASTGAAGALGGLAPSAVGSLAENEKRKRRGKKGLRGKLSLGGRLPSIFRRGKRPLSEEKLRKKLQKAADRGDWETVRKLIAGYEFSDLEPADAAPSPKRTSFNLEEPPATRRPSYGSREQRRSFNGSFTGESAAAAAAIRAAALEEGSDSRDDCGPQSTLGSGSRRGGTTPSCAPASGAHCRCTRGENILHDACRHRSLPLDVLETLLAALRHRRGCAAAIDSEGRTPLHVAAAAGVDPAAIDALVRADPLPATIGDGRRRSPLHLAVRELAGPPRDLLPHERASPPSERTERALRTVRVLKDAMLSYPGRVDFKDEDGEGFSPLDYALQANLKNVELLQALIRRREPRCRRGSRRAVRKRGNYLTCGRSVYSGASSVTDDLQDIEIIEQLENDEIEARRARIEKIMERRRREELESKMNDALFDVFGIDEVPAPVVAPTPAPETKAAPPAEQPSAKAKPPAKSPEASEVKTPAAPTMDDAEIYRRHMEDYLADFMDDFEGLEGDLAFHDDDGEFDIFHDPEEDPDLGAHVEYEIVSGPPVAEIVVTGGDADDGASLVSEVTVPLAAMGSKQKLID